MEQRKEIRRRIRRMMNKPQDVYFQAKLSMFLVTVALFIGLTIMSIGIRNHYVKALEENADNLARGYALSLTKTVEAGSLVEKLIHEKLSTVSGFISDFGSDLRNEDLIGIAEKINVEEINIYSPEGIILISNFPDYISWSPPKGHHVEMFMQSNLDAHIDPIRSNTITGHLVLYGYSRMDDGRFVQVGINAKDLENLIESFELNAILKDMLNHPDVAYVRYLSNRHVVLGSSDGAHVGEVLSDTGMKRNLTEALGIGKYNLYPAGDVHDVHEPVKVEETKVGTLVLGISLGETRDAIRKLSTSGSVILLMIYFVAILVIYLLYRKNSRLFSLAYQDDLTSLPNIRSLKRDLETNLLSQKRDQLALMLIQVPQLNRIMMSRGYNQGDAVLLDTADHLFVHESPRMKVYRYSDEKFIMLSRNYGSRENLVRMVESIGRINSLVEDEQSGKRFGALEFGVLEVTDDYDQVEDILKDVLIALSNVKDEGKTYVFFDETMESTLKRESIIENEIREALDQEDDTLLTLAFQPIVDATTGRVRSVEVLTRMKSRHYGDVSPVEFIFIAEKTGLMVALGKSILEKAMGFISRLNSEGYLDIRVAVNISGIQLIQDDFAKIVKDTLDAAGVSPSSLELEITESVFLSSYERVNQKLKELKDLGIAISIDDFGTGYSSFARLKELNVDTVKIDKFFISRISTLEEHELITGDIIRMVHRAGLLTVAEGVETKTERDYLAREGCDFLQGYFYSRPMKEEDMHSYIRTHG